MKDLHSTPFPSHHTSQCDSCILQQHSLRSPDFSQALVGGQKGYQTYRDLPWDLQKIHQPAIKIRHLEPWKIALIVIGTAVAAAVTIGLLVYFLAYDQKLFYYSGNVKITNIRYNNELSRQSSGRFRDLSERIERLIDKTFYNSILRKKYIRSRLIRVSPDADGVMAEALLTFWFSSTDSREALRERVERILRRGLKKYTGPLRINVRSSTISNMETKRAEALFNDICGLRQNRSVKSMAKSSSLRIVGGLSSAETGDWPWQASLQYNNIHRCGATLISDTWLVSAAHCFRDMSHPRKWTATFGALLKPPSLKRSVKIIIIHEKYRYPEHDYDIALVQLSKRVEFTSNIHRVCLPEPSQTFPYNIYAVITGWGALTNDGPTPNALQEATVKLINSNTCNRKEVYDGDITPRMLCAGYLEGGVDACQGDSGGPLVTPDSRLMWYLVGIVSWGDECAKPNKPGVYTRVTYFRDWITSKTGV
ncbi:transmembrane protease serine 11E-like [Aptenodytes patagonicus]|nr:PREDICTED: transmembrane protease serine 11E-like [Aptenodytes forsteri]